jgi:hypothetical protein
VSTFGLRACPVLYDIASEIHIGTAVSLLKADRLEAYPTFARVGCVAKQLHAPYGKIHYRGLDPKKSRASPMGDARKRKKGKSAKGKRVTSSDAA